MRTVPLSGSISRLMNFRVVVLPEPDAPTSATKRPDSTCSVTSWTANVRPSSNDLQSLPSSLNGTMLNWPRKRQKERSFGHDVVRSHRRRDLQGLNHHRGGFAESTLHVPILKFVSLPDRPASTPPH